MPLPPARTLTQIGDVAAAAWDALFASPYPFTRHAFLDALERHDCVGAGTGWEPCHLVIDDPEGGLAAAMPLYRKRHSYGEFVFDFGWARAAQQLGLRYYPKLVCAVPFTPAAGPRLAARTRDAGDALIEAARRHVADTRASSLHVLFAEAETARAFGAAGWLERHDLQFHWNARGAATFADFVGALRSEKRKKILRERREVADAGIHFEWLRGDAIDEPLWAQIYAMYANTYDERGQAPYLTLDFFLDYGRRDGTPLRVILARHQERPVAAALTLAAGDTLYGRHWGCLERYRGLHFETCYYQGIELCLAEGLTRFDAGAQGAHKLARGFEPVVTRSLHRLADERLAAPVAAFLDRERAEVSRQHALLAEHSPYRSEGSLG